MADCLTHVLDEETPEDGVRLLSLLLEHVPSSQVLQQIVVIGRTPPMLIVPEHVTVAHVGRRLNIAMISTLDLQRVLARQKPDVILAWSAAAAAMTGFIRSTRGGPPFLTIISDPAQAARSSRWWHSFGFDHRPMHILCDVVCTSKTIQQKLVESGVPLEATVVIRPGVDFGAIRRAKETFRRTMLGLPEKGRILLTASPPSRQGGQFYAVWATAILHHIRPDACLVIPGTSREQSRILRLIDNIYCPHIYFPTADRFSPAELLAVSDMLIVPAIGEIPTGWLAWAMAASVPIVGSAVPAVTELIADRHNGFLCKPGEPHTLAIRIKTAADSGQTRQQCVNTAAGQAYDCFRAQRCADEYLQVIRHVLQGRRAAENLPDATINA